MKSPAEMGEAAIREYLHHLVEERKVGPATQKMALAAISFLYAKTLGRPEEVARIPWPKVESKLPDVLTQKDLAELFSSAATLLDRVAFMVAYGAGLRVGEVCKLTTDDIDSVRQVIRVRCGKGGKDRITMLSPSLLSGLRHYWKEEKPKGPWLFPGRTDEHTNTRRLQQGFRKAATKASLSRNVTFHSLRHSFATYMLEAGVDIRVIQAMLGHKSLKTTSRYTRVRADLIRSLPDLLEFLKDQHRRDS
jgi:site-specific recombinase XerD